MPVFTHYSQLSYWLEQCASLTDYSQLSYWLEQFLGPVLQIIPSFPIGWNNFLYRSYRFFPAFLLVRTIPCAGRSDYSQLFFWLEQLVTTNSSCTVVLKATKRQRREDRQDTQNKKSTEKCTYPISH